LKAKSAGLDLPLHYQPSNFDSAGTAAWEESMKTIVGSSFLTLSISVLLWGAIVQAPAEFAIAGLPPDAPSTRVSFFDEPRTLWQLPWFRGAILIALASALYAAHRFRIGRALSVEKLRAQIATDLHDEIGSGLSQISILSGAAERSAGSREPNLKPLLDRIGEISRELADSMSDIVWNLDPKHDHLGDLIYRMRRFADELLGGSNIVFDLTVKGSTAIPLEVAARREIFMIFKESLHNAVRHSGCTQMRIEITCERNDLLLCVTDDGKGFLMDRQRAHSSGLENMRKRAGRLRGKLEIHSQPGHGTSVRLAAPVFNRR
jgi:signal transduction histidine kinase